MLRFQNLLMGMLIPLFFSSFALGKDRVPEPDVRVIPFQLAKKLILVEAYVNGQKGSFILDTGAASLVLNRRYFKSSHLAAIEAVDFAGHKTYSDKREVSFGWDRNRNRPVEAMITPLEKIELLIDEKIMGYIGYELLRKKEVLFDYHAQTITLYALDRKGNRKNDTALNKAEKDTFHLHANSFMPYITVLVGESKLKFAIDSGAGINLLRSKSLKEIADNFIEQGSRQIAGFNGQQQTCSYGKLMESEVDAFAIPSMDFVLSEMRAFNRSLPRRLDGLLGYEFLHQHSISINYRLNEVYLWKTSADSRPLADHAE